MINLYKKLRGEIHTNPNIRGYYKYHNIYLNQIITGFITNINNGRSLFDHGSLEGEQLIYKKTIILDKNNTISKIFN